MSFLPRRNRALSRILPAEIVEFCRFLEPTAAEALERQEAVNRVSAVITGIWKSASVEIFGSFVTGGQAWGGRWCCPSSSVLACDKSTNFPQMYTRVICR